MHKKIKSTISVSLYAITFIVGIPKIAMVNDTSLDSQYTTESGFRYRFMGCLGMTRLKR